MIRTAHPLCTAFDFVLPFAFTVPFPAGLNTLYLVYFIIYSLGVVIHIYALREMCCTARLHPVRKQLHCGACSVHIQISSLKADASRAADVVQIVKLLTTTIFLQYASIFCGLVHYGTFVSNGHGVPLMKSGAECKTPLVR